MLSKEVDGSKSHVFHERALVGVESLQQEVPWLEALQEIVGAFATMLLAQDYRSSS